MSSHHDALLSSFSIPYTKDNPSAPNASCISAPKLELQLRKIIWSSDGILKYENKVKYVLKSIRDRWLHPDSLYSMSILLKMTSVVLDNAASSTNKFKDLMTPLPSKSKRIPRNILTAKRKLRRLNTKATNSPLHQHKLREAKFAYKAAIRKCKLQTINDRDNRLFEIVQKNPSSVYRFINSCKKTQTSKTESLHVQDKLYKNEDVADGFYDAMSSLKSANINDLREDPYLVEQFSNYEIIRELCRDGSQIPFASIETTTRILTRLKKDVRDIHNLTTLHFLNAGVEGLNHFNQIMNGIISNVNNASLEDLNLVLGIILYKGHNNNNKTSSRSYRTISTCPVVAKAIDLYLRDLYHHHWDAMQAPTQYQGTGSNHELAALLVTEVIQHSLYTAKEPVFMLLLDAESAFDRCLRQILCAQIYKSGIKDQALLMIDNRLASRSTVYKWDEALMGPSPDVTGFEQGGINSSDWYKLYNNEQLLTSQNSNLGVNIKSSVISAVGQADDVILFSNTIFNLNLLSSITQHYCNKFRVKLVPSKTKLLAYCLPEFQHKKDIAELLNQVKINGVHVPFSDEAEHVGVLRHISGNKPNILKRIVAHKKSLHVLLSAGLRRGQRSNPAASLRVHSIYNTPVLLSGLASLVLSKDEIRLIDSHYLTTLQNLQRLHDKTPRSVTLFLAGSLPAEALLHLRQLSLFSMITRLVDDPLNAHAHYILTTAARSAKSWFQQIRGICLQYGLPHPLELLQYPLSKTKFKALAKKHVIMYWENHLLEESGKLSSLCYLDVAYFSLQKTCLMWTTAGSNPFENSKALVVARMLSGRYRTEYLTRHWTPSNSNGFCLAATCQDVIGNLTHLLIECPSLHSVRRRMISLWLDKTASCSILGPIFLSILFSEPDEMTQFILNPLINEKVQAIIQNGQGPHLKMIFYLTRTYAYYLSREKYRATK